MTPESSFRSHDAKHGAEDRVLFHLGVERDHERSESLVAHARDFGLEVEALF